MNHVVKSICLLSGMIVFLAASVTSAKTLKEMAQTSNLLLVLADRSQTQGAQQDPQIQKRSCGMSYEQISARSQRLKSKIDQKIESLTEGDFKILNTRVASCEHDCTCDIYALAFEKKDKPADVLNQKAAVLTPKDREKCVQKLKKICDRARF